MKHGRRPFLYVLALASVVLALAPYVPWGEFLSASIRGSGKLVTQKVVIDNNQLYKTAAGKAVNVNDLATFPPNSHWSITYPSSGDSTLDAQNTDSFFKFDLIRLPAELGGDKKEAAAFVAFSKVCVHLWCSPNYGGGPGENPSLGHRQYECPCHGSLYSVGEPTSLNGKTVSPPVGLAVDGPAAIQPPPTNAIPLLTLTVDSNGFLYAGLYNSTEKEGGTWDLNHNGVIGLGRYLPGE